MKELKRYQEEAIEELLTHSNLFFNKEDKKTIVFQSPTGSGKTFTIARYMLELVNSKDRDLCFLWISIGSGELHKQSMKSVKREIGDVLTCTLLENEFFGSRQVINQNEVVFVNWEKIKIKDKDTGDFKNVVMKKKETINFPEVLKNTRDIGRQIVLIIDESHLSSTTSRAKEIRDEIIVPDLTIEMSATPVLINNMHAKVEVNPTHVISEGMIKKEIIINQDIEKIVDDEIDSERLILESAYQKREELAKKYKEQGTNINPLVLIQIPNSTAGELKKESSMKFLEEKGITRENGKLAMYLDGDTLDKNSDELVPLDGKFEYLIFKEAIGTGWDCPRAQILVKFRETNSITFEIQTVGRILRMPEAKHYMDETLNKAYVYTNIQSIAIKKEVYNPNIIKTICSKRKDSYTSTPLKSYYRNRVDFGDITSSFYTVFEHYFCEYFEIKQIQENELTDYYSNSEKLNAKGIITEYQKNDGIISNLKIASDKVDDDIKFNTTDLLAVGISPADLEIKYEQIIANNLNGFAPKRSIPTVKQAILYTFNKYLNLKSARGGIMYIQNLVVSNELHFNTILNKATDKYKIVHEMEVNDRCDEEFIEEWEIEPTKNYNPETNVELKSKLSLYQPLYIETKSGKVDQLEVDFMEYLDKNENSIDWFWKNGAEHMKTNFGIQKSDKSTFQPDFLIKFKDGKIGIFDTKAISYNEADNEIKSNALYKYISEERYRGKNLIGGLIVKDGNKFKYFEEPLYETYAEAKDKWKDFDDLF